MRLFDFSLYSKKRDASNKVRALVPLLNVPGTFPKLKENVELFLILKMCEKDSYEMGLQ